MSDPEVKPDPSNGDSGPQDADHQDAGPQDAASQGTPGGDPATAPKSKAAKPDGKVRKALKRVLPKKFFDRKPVVAVVKMTGTIAAGNSSFKQNLSISSTAATLEKAFSLKGAEAVAILMNSPGGSPVQSTLIFKRIRALAEEKELPVFVFCEDVAASGGYLIALAGDEIYADKSSIIGSIGVISAGFGFVDAIDKLGIQRRVYTSGEKKMSLDPFSKENNQDIKRLKAIQSQIHDVFKEMVSSRRGDKIAGREEELFTGEFWAGEAAVERGLIDGIADVRGLMRERYGDKVKLKVVGGEKGWFMRRFSTALAPGGAALDGLSNDSGFSQQLVEGGLSALEARALWSRFGL